MKLVATEVSRLLLLIVMDEIRPLGGAFMPAIFRAIMSRYEFVVGPTDIADAIKNGAKFEHGRFVSAAGPIVINDIGIFNDGIVVGAPTTDYADAITDDLLGWATSTFGLRERTTLKPRTYTSNVVVEFDRAAERALGRFESLSRKMSAALAESRGWGCGVSVQRLAFQADPLTLPSSMMPPTSTQFSIERRGGAPYAQNRFWCAAPLRTGEHLALLEAIEADLASTD